MCDYAALDAALHNIEKKKKGEKMKVTYKVCFPLKINEEGLHFDDEVKKVGNNMTSIL